MKNQFFGDENDYKKFSLLRLLTQFGKLKVTVCWMLTDNNFRSDGRHTEYLLEPKVWRPFDPAIFDLLRDSVITKSMRDVNLFEKSNLLPTAAFYSERLPENRADRSQYFKTLMEFAHGSDLIFFDPDNGIEVKSTPYGKKGYSKYLYWKELVPFFQAGHSLLIYQHFPRSRRDMYIRNLSAEIEFRTGATHIYCFYTSRVLFVLIPQARHDKDLAEGVGRLKTQWGSVMKLFTDKHKFDEQTSLGICHK